MKKLFCLFLLLSIIAAQACYAQYNLKEINASLSSPKLMKMPYASSGGEKGVSIFEYDNSGKLTKSLWKLLDNTRSSENYYTYDESGNIIKKYREFSDGLTSTENFIYNEKDLLINEAFKRSDGLTYQISYSYNDLNQVTIAHLQNYHGWLTGDIHYSYSNEGQLAKGKIFREDSEIGFINFTYNNKNQLIEEFWEFTGSYSQTFTFEYDDN